MVIKAKNLEVGSSYLIDPKDRYEDYLLEVKILAVTPKAVKWERQDRKAEERHPSWISLAKFEDNYTIIEQL